MQDCAAISSPFYFRLPNRVIVRSWLIRIYLMTSNVRLFDFRSVSRVGLDARESRQMIWTRTMCDWTSQSCDIPRDKVIDDSRYNTCMISTIAVHRSPEVIWQ